MMNPLGFMSISMRTNTLSIGRANEGNHPTMVVIPNNPAIDGVSTPNQGPVDLDYPNHYDLLRQMEAELSRD